MIRKLSTVIVALVVAFAMLPTLTAAAAVTSTARILDNVALIPQTAPRTFTIEATHSQGSVLSLQGALPANAVRVVLPPGLSQAGCVAKDGWTCVATNTANSRSVLFTANVAAGNAGIARGESATFQFTSPVAAPSSKDRTETLEVDLSDDGGRTFTDSTPTAAGALTLVTRILEILNFRFVGLFNGTSSVAGFTNARGTAGQVARVAFDVRNYGAQPVTVNPNLAVPATETITADAADAPVAARAAAPTTFTYDVTLGAVDASNTNAVVTRLAELTGSAVSTADPNTQTGNLAFGVTIEEPVNVLTASNRFLPRVIPDGETQNFTLSVDKPQLQGVTGLTGQLELFRDGSAAGAPAAITADLDNPAAFTRATGATTSIPLEFNGVIVDLDVIGEQLLDGRLTLSGTDDNGRPYTQVIELPDLLTIDALSPILNLNPITIVSAATGQTRANGGNTIRISGTLDQAADVPRGPAPAQQGGGYGPGVRLTVALPGLAPVELSPTFSGTGQTGTFTVDYPLTPASANALGTGLIQAAGTAFDSAGNRSITASQTIEFDKIAPTLTDPAIAIVDQARYGTANPVIQVNFDEQYGNTPPVRGACLPTQWEVDNATVTQVLFSDGTACNTLTGVTQGPDNIRILVLDRAVNPEAAGSVDYFATRGLMGIGNDPARDAANNSPLETITRAIRSGVAPLAPVIQELTRGNISGPTTEDGREAMGINAGIWYTNVPSGTDPVVRFGGNLNNVYSLQVFRQDGTTLTLLGEAPADVEQNPNREVRLTQNGGISTAANGTQTLLQARIVNRQGTPSPADDLFSPLTSINVVFDNAAPRLANAETISNGVRVTFSEPLRLGLDSATDWFALERNADPGDGGAFFAYGVDGVTPVSGNLAARDLAVNLGGNGTFAGADFIRVSGPANEVSYEDFAGNLHAATDAIIVG